MSRPRFVLLVVSLAGCAGLAFRPAALCACDKVEELFGAWEAKYDNPQILANANWRIGPLPGRPNGVELQVSRSNHPLPGLGGDFKATGIVDPKTGEIRGMTETGWDLAIALDRNTDGQKRVRVSFTKGSVTSKWNGVPLKGA